MTTTAADKGSPKGGDVSRIGKQPPPLRPREKFLAWLKEYATLLSVTGVLILDVIGSSALLRNMTSARIDDTKALVGSVGGRLTDQIKDVKAEVGRVEVRLGARIDDMRLDLRDARQDRKADMGILRQDIQALRQDISTLRNRP